MRKKTNVVLGLIGGTIVATFTTVGYVVFDNYNEVNNITSILQEITAYVDKITGDNEFATGAILAGLLGSLTYIGRSIPENVYNFVKKHTTTTIATDSTQESYHNMMRYFMNEGLSDLSRYIKLGNGQYGEDNETIKEIGYGSQVFIYRNNFIFVHHYKEEQGGSSNVVKNFIEVTKFGRSHLLFDKLINDMRNQRDKNKTSYYTWNYDKEFITSQPKQNIDNVIMTEDNRHILTNTIKKFVENEEWYLDQVIPYQLGILLYGPPGTGKTTLVRAIAAYINKDIVFVDKLTSLIMASQQINDSIIVVEEIDTFALGKRDESGKSSDNTTIDQDDESGTKEFVKDMKNENLGNVLTALDGIITNHGRILVMTTNHKETLDDALLRPGRIDLKLEIGYLDKNMMDHMLSKFFKIGLPMNRLPNENITPVMIQNDVINGVKYEDIVYKYTYEV